MGSFIQRIHEKCNCEVMRYLIVDGINVYYCPFCGIDNIHEKDVLLGGTQFVLNPEVEVK